MLSCVSSMKSVRPRISEKPVASGSSHFRHFDLVSSQTCENQLRWLKHIGNIPWHSSCARSVDSGRTEDCTNRHGNYLRTGGYIK